MSTAAQLIQQGKAEMLLDLLQTRFPNLPASVRARVFAADAATLTQWAKRVLTATSIDEVLAN